MSRRLQIAVLSGWLGLWSGFDQGRTCADDDRPATKPVTANAAATAAAPAADAKTYRLAYKFTPNQIVHYQVMHEMEIVNQVNEATESAHNKSETRKHYRVAAAGSDGSGDLELTLDRVHMTAAVGARPAEIFKSDDPAFHPKTYQHILASVGKPQATIRFSPTGAPLKVVAAPPPAAQANNPATVPSDSPETSDESYLTPLPDRPIAVGEVWKERFQLPMKALNKLPLRIDLLRTYRLAAVEGNRARIEFKTSILTPNLEPEISAQLIQREIAGTLIFDLEQGWIVSRDVAVERTVVNALGPKSSMHAVSKYRERLVNP